MKVLNTILIICACLLFFIGIETPEDSSVNNNSSKPQLSLEQMDLRTNFEKVIDQIYPM